jgi:hypothetical protein
MREYFLAKSLKENKSLHHKSKVAFYYRTAYQVYRTNDDETSPTDDRVDEVDLEFGVCPSFCIPITKSRICTTCTVSYSDYLLILSKY